MSNPSYQLADRYHAETGTVLLTGIQALARLPIEQLRRDQAEGLNTAAFLSGYPGSPLGGLDQEIARAKALVPTLPIVHQPAVNEELGATSVMGSQLASGRPDATYLGVTGYWYGKAPGLDRAGDALRHGVFAGASPHGGAVVMVGDDPACKSSTMPSSSDATLVDLHMPVLYPGTIAECIELGMHAVALSRASGLWTAMKIVTPVADGSGTVALPVLGGPLPRPTVEVDGKIWQCQPSAKFLGQRMLDVEREFRETRIPLAQRYGVETGLNRVTVNPADAWIGLVATGFTYYEMLDALRRLGFTNEAEIAGAGIRVLQLRMPVPFDTGIVRRFAEGLEEIVVIEEKNATLESLIKDALYGGPSQPRVLGKTHPDGAPLMRSWGQLDADAIGPGLRARLLPKLAERLSPAWSPDASPSRPVERKLIPLSVNRTPFFCSGCPHNWGTKVPDDAVVGAGTGCHGMILLMDEDRVGDGIGVTAMGNEGAQWVGMEPFVEANHLFQNYGDGTFFHSGQLALQYCVGAGKDMTFKILYNGTVAMTGGQDSPAPMSVAQLCQVLLAYGVTKVAVTAEDTDRYKDITLPDGVKVHPRQDIVKVQEDLQALKGVTVLVHDQFCAAELRRARRRGKLTMPTERVVINHRICEGCGDCGDVSNCLSVQPLETPLGRKTTIDQNSCNFDYSCLEGDCPSFMTVDTTNATQADGTNAPASHVPAPTVLVDADIVRIRMAGIGGTGVVTVAQILSTAAMFDGWDVRGLDQTGLSQKAGPVVSDVVLSRAERASSNLVGEGQAHLLLGFDALVAASPNALSAAVGDRTAVVASTHTTPTGAMISAPETPYPSAEIIARLNAATSDSGNAFVDATEMALALTGASSSANIFLLGVALQAGHLPVSVEAIEQAIELNGVAVEANLTALDWGRRWAHDPSAVSELARAAAQPEATITMVVPDLPPTLAQRAKALDAVLHKQAAPDQPAGVHQRVQDPAVAHVETLAADLVGYQNAKYAAQYLATVERAVRAEQKVMPASTAFGAAVAQNLHKLMAYKDEYEVARLMLGPEASEAVSSVGGPDAKFAWRLHPPMLKALGLDNKIPVGSWAKPGIVALAAGKRLRGTRFDPFGRTEMRTLERALIDEYVAAIEIVATTLDAARLDAGVALALLPDQVRGFEDLKLARAAVYRDQLASALQEFT